MAKGDHPELDHSKFCTPLQHAQFRALVGSANWCIAPGRFDMAFSTQSLARFNMVPQFGHLKRMMRVFGCLKTHPDGAIIVDPALPDHDKCKLPEGMNWKEFYLDAKPEKC